MAVLTVRKVPEEVASKLRKLAKREGRSVEDQVRRILREAVLDRSASLKEIDVALKKRSPLAYKFIAQGIREGRK